MKNIFKIIIIFVLLVIVFLVVNYNSNDLPAVPVNSFNDCVEAGNSVMESYPRQCITLDGRHFVEDIGNELEQVDLIRVDSPRPNTLISSPLTVSGSARGYWFFEADAPVFLYDNNNDLISTGIATAIGNWMTEDIIGFKAELEFDLPDTKTGWLILQNDNPSDLRENDRELRIPIKFK
jgi:hypothetical protein